MANLLSGEQNHFAVKLSTDDRFARISFFCASEEIGGSEYTLLNTLASLIRKKVDNYNFSLADKLISLDKNDVFSYVVEGYENSDNWRDSQKISAVWITLDLSPSFDGDVFILLSSDNFDRIIWRRFNESEIKEHFLPAGYVLEQMELLLHNVYK